MEVNTVRLCPSTLAAKSPLPLRLTSGSPPPPLRAEVVTRWYVPSVTTHPTLAQNTSRYPLKVQFNGEDASELTMSAIQPDEVPKCRCLQARSKNVRFEDARGISLNRSSATSFVIHMSILSSHGRGSFALRQELEHDTIPTMDAAEERLAYPPSHRI